MKLLEGSSSPSLDIAGAGYNDIVRGTIEITVDGVDISAVYGLGLEDWHDPILMGGFRNRVLNEGNAQNAIHILIKNAQLEYVDGLGMGYGSQASDEVNGNVLVEIQNSTIKQLTIGGTPTNYANGYGAVNGDSTIRVTGSSIQTIYGHKYNYENDAAGGVALLFDGAGESKVGFARWFKQVTVENSAEVTVNPDQFNRAETENPFYSVNNLTITSGGKLTTGGGQENRTAEILNNALIDGGEWTAETYMKVGTEGGDLTIQNGGKLFTKSQVWMVEDATLDNGTWTAESAGGKVAYVYGDLKLTNGGHFTSTCSVQARGNFEARSKSILDSSGQFTIGQKGAYTSAVFDDSTWNDKKSAYVYGPMTLQNGAQLNQIGSFRTYSNMTVTDSAWENHNTSATVDGDLTAKKSTVTGEGERTTEAGGEGKQFNIKGNMDIQDSTLTSDLKFFVGGKVSSSNTMFRFSRSFIFGNNISDPNQAVNNIMWSSNGDTVTITDEKREGSEEVYYYVHGDAEFEHTTLILMDPLSIWGNYTNKQETAIRLPAFAAGENYPEEFIPLEIGGLASGETPVTLVKNSGDFTEEGQPIEGHNYINAQQESADVFKLANANAKDGGYYFKKLADANKENYGYDMWQVAREERYGVLYEFKTGTRGASLPDPERTPEMPELPVDNVTYAMGDTVTAILPDPTSFIGRKNDNNPDSPLGVWTFKGYDAATKVVNADNLENGADPSDSKKYIVFTGTWTWEELEEVTVRFTPQDMTAYTGGDSISGDTFPTARYKVEAADEVDLSKLTFTVNGQAETLPEDTESGDIVLLPWLDETFTLKESASIRSLYANEAVDDSIAGEYEIGIDTTEVSAAYTEGNPVEMEIKTGTLTVRNVSQPEEVISGDVDIAQPVVTEAAQVNTDDGIGIALIPQGTTYYTNGKAELGVLGNSAATEPQISLLFDDLLSGEAGEDTKQLLMERAEEEGYLLTDDNSQFKYLDLINENDGNAWISTNNGAVITIYWPCPEGVNTDDFTAQVLHFKGLHREYRSNLEEQVQNAQVEIIEAQIVDGNIVFQLTGNQTAGSFSPFAIYWKENPPEQTSVAVTKVWEDNNDQDGKRPESVTVKLLAGGQDTGETLILNQGNGWQDSFTNLNKCENDTEISYSVAEVPVEGYTTQIAGDAATGYTITNSHTPETITISGSKTWDDTNNQDGKRPDSITIRLYANGEQVEVVTVTAGDGWAWEFENVPRYENGIEIRYTITEDAVDGYQSEIDGMNVTNHYTPGKVNIPVTKNWQDKDDADSIRPDSITVKLYADGEDTGKELVLDQEHNWTGSFGDLDEYADGVKIVYTIAEVEVDGYDTVISGSAETGFVITNSHTPDEPDEPNTPTNPDQPKDDAPQTGDATNLALWIGLLAVSGTGLTATVVLGKKKRYRGKHMK